MKLFRGEKLLISDSHQDDAFMLSDNAINEKYVKGEVRIVTEQARYPLNSIVAMLDSGDYNLNPEFQRRHRWDRQKQSRLIESFIMNVPIPPIFLYEDRYSHYEVMDGLQRLTAIYEFYRNSFGLEGLEEWPELNGRKFSSLPDQVRRGIDRRYLSSIILLQETAKTDREADILKQLVFERINSGGVKLEPQEARNAIYNGPLNKICIRLARNKFLCRTWGIPEPTDEERVNNTFPEKLLRNDDFRTMADVELVLRFFAYRQRRDLHRGRLRDYLDVYLKHGNAFPREVLERLENLFVKTIELVFGVLGERAFWLYRIRNGEWHWLKRPTTAVYDPLMFVFSRADVLLKRKKSFQAKMPEFYKKNYEDFEGRNTNLSILNLRDDRFDELVRSVLGE
jgi:hypothetical protein